MEARHGALCGQDAPAVVRRHIGACPVACLLDGDDTLPAGREVTAIPTRGDAGPVPDEFAADGFKAV